MRFYINNNVIDVNGLKLIKDEFVILLPNTTYVETEEIVNSIKNRCKNQKIESIEISISFRMVKKKIWKLQ